MGDVLMTEPAIRALKESSNAEITLLTSHSGSLITPLLQSIDKTIVADLPWVRTPQQSSLHDFENLIGIIKKEEFDASIVFTNYSQNPAPGAMLAYLAGIPRRLAYSRENIYTLLTDWVMDREPFIGISHSVARNIRLVERIGASVFDPRIKLKKTNSFSFITDMLLDEGVDFRRPWIVVHPWVRNDPKRMYPLEDLARAAKILSVDYGYQILITGEISNRQESESFVKMVGPRAFNFAGRLSLEEVVVLLKQTPLLLSNNTGLVHIASALGTSVVVMYARTNMEHVPWMVRREILYFDPPTTTKTPILRFSLPRKKIQMPNPTHIVNAALRLLQTGRPKNYDYLNL